MRQFDIVLWGCTGFTGGLVAEYFALHAPEGIKWALAGRTRNKIEEVRSRLSKLNPDCAELEIILADINQSETLDNMAAQTKVILSSAGPFTLYGTPIVDACVKQSTSYCDITGETPWVRELIDKYHDVAVEKGIHIVPMCGFDSIPFDLGAFMMAKAANKYGGAKWIRSGVTANGKPSGGTLHTILLLVGITSPRLMRDRRLLNPPNHQSDPLPSGTADQMIFRYDRAFQSWTSPFIMAGANTRVVRRSQCLYADAGQPYGPENQFYYNEAELQKGFFAAFFSTLALGIVMILIALRPTRALLKRFIPSPGQGPSAETRAKSWFRIQLACETVNGKMIKGLVAGGDPGYSETAKMLSNSAFCLVDKESLPSTGGVLTPARAMGDRLLTRLREAGMTFEVLE